MATYHIGALTSVEFATLTGEVAYLADITSLASDIVRTRSGAYRP